MCGSFSSILPLLYRSTVDVVMSCWEGKAQCNPMIQFSSVAQSCPTLCNPMHPPGASAGRMVSGKPKIRSVHLQVNEKAQTLFSGWLASKIPPQDVNNKTAPSRHSVPLTCREHKYTLSLEAAMSTNKLLVLKLTWCFNGQFYYLLRTWQREKVLKASEHNAFIKET